jgi:hypothetical protein
MAAMPAAQYSTGVFGWFPASADAPRERRTRRNHGEALAAKGAAYLRRPVPPAIRLFAASFALSRAEHVTFNGEVLAANGPAYLRRPVPPAIHARNASVS